MTKGGGVTRPLFLRSGRLCFRMTFPGTRWEEEVKEEVEIDEDDEIVGNGLCWVLVRVLLKLGGGSIWILWIERERRENQKVYVSCVRG